MLLENLTIQPKKRIGNEGAFQTQIHTQAQGTHQVPKTYLPIISLHKKSTKVKAVTSMFHGAPIKPTTRTLQVPDRI